MKFCPECFVEFEDNLTQCPEDNYTLTKPEPDPLLGTVLADRYEIVSVLGRGGMGVVYQAKQQQLDRIVAIKMLHLHLVSDTDALKRFHREAKAVSRVHHPHSVTLYDFGISPKGQPYIVMDLIEGTSLKRILKNEGPLSLDRANHIFQQVIEALACAHAQGVIHRDLKPENIMLSQKGSDPEWVEVVDFGISKLKGKTNQTVENITRVGDVCGSPPYMSPEQCLGSTPVDTRSDIYSLAVVLYETLAGRLPFNAHSTVEMIDCHLYALPTPLKVANPHLSTCDALTALLNKALQKEPEARPETMEELGLELREAILRDSIKLKSLRYSTKPMSGQTTALMPGCIEEFDEGGNPNPTEGQDNTKVVSSTLEANELVNVRHRRLVTPDNWLWASLKKLWLELRDTGGKAHQDTTEFLLANCPYCASAVDANIKFCLECGHNLPSAQELVQLRLARGVFCYPKSRKECHQVPEFSTKARIATSRPPGSGAKARLFLIVNLVILLLLCLSYLRTANEKASTASVNEGPNHAEEVRNAPRQ